MRSESVFGPDYSAAYDLLYREKDYSGECDFLEAALRRFGSGEQRSVLDLGCGTGGHALDLARRGYAVTGVDLSPHMIEIAHAKLGQLRAIHPEVQARFQVGDIETVDLGAKCDAAIMMFAVLGYVSDWQNLKATLRNVRRQLRDGATFIADFWYGPAVLCDRPGDRVRVIESENRAIVRTTSAELDTFSQVASIHFSLFDLSEEGRVVKSRETHRMRYFFGQELSLLCDASGFSLRSVCAFPRLDERPSESTWSAALIATAI